MSFQGFHRTNRFSYLNSALEYTAVFQKQLLIKHYSAEGMKLMYKVPT